MPTDDNIGMSRRGLNVTPTFDPEQPVSGHNWIANKAFEFIGRHCPQLLPLGVNKDDVHYGLAFADSPWLGRRETIDANHPAGTTVQSIREDLYGVVLSRGGGDGGPWGEAQVRYGLRGSNDKPNLYLEAYWLFEILWRDIGNVSCAVDNVSHYAHDTSLVADGTGGSKGALALGPGTKQHWNVSAGLYAIDLFDLASRFYPGSTIKPRLDQLDHRKTGRIVNHVGSADYNADAPATYLGGNPFILTSDGKPTWPIWVPEQFSLDGLLEIEARQSARVASIYLGWALHMIADLSVPFHAMNTSGQKHQKCEKEFDEYVRGGRLEHLPIIPSPGEGQRSYVYSGKPIFWPTILDDIRSTTFRRSYKSNLRHTMLGELIQTSKSYYVDVHEDTRESTEKTLAAFEHLADIALKLSIAMIVSINQYVRTVDNAIIPMLSLLLD